MYLDIKINIQKSIYIYIYIYIYIHIYIYIYIYINCLIKMCFDLVYVVIFLKNYKLD